MGNCSLVVRKPRFRLRCQLAADEERWQQTVVNMERAGLAGMYTRVRGVDLREPWAMEAAKAEGIIPNHFNFEVAQETSRQRFQDLEGSNLLGSAGCAASHFRAMTAALQEPMRKKLALVLEDDVILAVDIIPRLWRLVLKEAPCDWGVISLRSLCPYGECVSPHLARIWPDSNEKWWRCRHGTSFGLEGMLYRLSVLDNFHQTWRSVAFDDRLPRCLDADVALAGLADKVAYYAVPYIADPPWLQNTGVGSTRYVINAAV